MKNSKQQLSAHNKHTIARSTNGSAPPPITDSHKQNKHLPYISTTTIIVICLSLFAFLLTLNILLPLVGDDYFLLNRSNGFQSLFHSYYTWNARLYELLYGAFIVRLNPYIFDFFNAILGAIFILGLFALLFWDFRRRFNAQDIFLLCVMIFLLCTISAFEGIFLWGDGSVNYLWGGVGAILIMLHIKIFLLQRFDKEQHLNKKLILFVESKITIATLLLLSLTSAMSNEVLCVFAIMSYIVLFCACRVWRIKLPFYYKISFLLVILGLFYLLLAPGTDSRIATETARYDYMSLGEIWVLDFGDKIARIYLVLSNFAEKTPLFALGIIFSCAFFKIYTTRIFYKQAVIFYLSLCLFCVVLVKIPLLGIFALLCMQIYIYRTNPHNKANLAILVAFCVWIAMGFAYLQFAKNLPLRARSADLILLICICLMWLKTYIFSQKLMMILCALMLSFFTYTIYQYADLRYKWNALSEYIQSQKNLYGENAQIVYSAEKFKIDYFMIGAFFHPNDARHDKALDYFGYEYVFGVKSVEFK